MQTRISTTTSSARTGACATEQWANVSASTASQESLAKYDRAQTTAMGTEHANTLRIWSTCFNRQLTGESQRKTALHLSPTKSVAVGNSTNFVVASAMRVGLKPIALVVCAQGLMM